MEQSLPSSSYYSPPEFEAEKNYIFTCDWFCAGREEDLPTPGSLTVLDVLGTSILVARTKAGELKAHYNVCRHRGSQLCSTTPESENKWQVALTGGLTSAGTIKCPYHSWTYGLDGKLLSAPFLHDSPQFCKADFSLYPVALEVWGGFFFVRLTVNENTAPQGLAAHLGVPAERIRRYPLADLRTGKTIVYQVAANWKLILENYNECYHCGPVHPELCDVVPDFRRAGGANLEWERGVAHREGAYTYTHSGTTQRLPFPGLNQDELTRHKGEALYPNLMISLSCDHVAAFLLWPTGPEHTRIECRFLFHPSEIAKPDFDPSDAVELWDLTNRQDWAICERVQLGIKSPVLSFGFYAPMEDPSLDVRRYVRERLAAAKL